MKVINLLTIFLTASLLFCSCSKDDGVTDDSDSAINCDSFTVNNGEDITEGSPTSVPTNSTIFNVVIETPNTDDLVTVEIIEQTPTNNPIIVGTYASSSTSKTINIPFISSDYFLTSTDIISGKIKATIDGTTCSKTINFTVTVINPNDITSN